MNLGRDISTSLGLNIKISEQIIESNNGTLKGLIGTHGWFGHIWMQTFKYRENYTQITVNECLLRRNEWIGTSKYLYLMIA